MVMVVAMMMMVMIVFVMMLFMFFVMMMPVVLIPVIMAVMLMIVSAAVFLAVMVVMMALLLISPEELFLQAAAVLHRFLNHVPGQFIPRCRDNRRLPVVIPQQGNALLQLFFRYHLAAADYDCGSGLDLVVEKFTKVLDMQLCLFSVHNRNAAVNFHLGRILHFIYCACHIGKLSHTRRLNDDPIRLKFIDYLL